jgi:hypothetical protein
VINNLRPVKLITDDEGEVYGIWTTTHWRPLEELLEEFRKLEMEREVAELEELMSLTGGQAAIHAKMYAAVILASHLSAEVVPTVEVETVSRVGINLFEGANWKVHGPHTIDLNTNLQEFGYYVRLTVQNGRIVKMKKMSSNENVSEVLLEHGHDFLSHIYQLDFERR